MTEQTPEATRQPGRKQSGRKPTGVSRTAAEKARRKAVYVAREDDRRAAAERAALSRYVELKGELARVGLRIGPIADLRDLDDPVKRYEVLKARVERWDALWSITQRKRLTRGKIIIGGAILAEIVDLDPEVVADRTFILAVMALLDSRVERVRDRHVVRELIGSGSVNQGVFGLSLRRGGPLNEPVEEALAALGESLSAFERGTFGGGAYDHDSGEEADLSGFGEPPGREGECVKFSA
jgi:hypothetical protein